MGRNDYRIQMSADVSKIKDGLNQCLKSFDQLSAGGTSSLNKINNS
jgi:hypothetical protein